MSPLSGHLDFFFRLLKLDCTFVILKHVTGKSYCLTWTNLLKGWEYGILSWDITTNLRIHIFLKNYKEFLKRMVFVTYLHILLNVKYIWSVLIDIIWTRSESINQMQICHELFCCGKKRISNLCLTQNNTGTITYQFSSIFFIVN